MSNAKLEYFKTARIATSMNIPISIIHLHILYLFVVFLTYSIILAEVYVTATVSKAQRISHLLIKTKKITLDKSSVTHLYLFGHS